MKDKIIIDKLNEIIKKQSEIINLLNYDSNKDSVKFTNEELNKYYNYKLKLKSSRTPAEVKMYGNILENMILKARARERGNVQNRKDTLIKSLQENQLELINILKQQ